MKKRLFIYVSVICFMLAIIGCSEQDNHNSNALANKPSSNEYVNTQNINTEDQQNQCKEIIVQRGSDCFTFENIQIDNAGIIRDIEDLLWIVPRGGAGIQNSGIDKDISEVPMINEINNAVNNHCKTNGNYTWIRLVYDPYIPEEGQNAIKHEDIILYLDPNNSSDAVFCIQNPKKESEWNITVLPDYGKWLSKEIDILLRIKTGL